jgi:hypothetical protein
VLRLDPVERMQLFQLALRQPVIDSAPRHETVSPPYRAHAPSDARIPAVVIGRRWDVLACNRGARAFLFDFEQVPSNERNLLCLMFTCTGFEPVPFGSVRSGGTRGSSIRWVACSPLRQAVRDFRVLCVEIEDTALVREVCSI